MGDGFETAYDVVSPSPGGKAKAGNKIVDAITRFFKGKADNVLDGLAGGSGGLGSDQKLPGHSGVVEQIGLLRRA